MGRVLKIKRISDELEMGWRDNVNVPHLTDAEPFNHSRTMYLLRLFSKEK